MTESGKSGRKGGRPAGRPVGRPRGDGRPHLTREEVFVVTARLVAQHGVSGRMFGSVGEEPSFPELAVGYVFLAAIVITWVLTLLF